MNRFKSVKIIHSFLQRINFSYLAEFFRFIGIFVCEEILNMPLEEKTEAEWNTPYNACVYVGKRDILAEDAQNINMSVEKYQSLLKDLPPKTIFLQDVLDAVLKGSNGEDGVSQEGTKAGEKPILNMGKTQQKKILSLFLQSLLDAVFEPSDVDRFEVEQLKQLIDIYVDNEICLHSLNMQYYGKRPSGIVTEAEKGFLAAHKAIQEVLEGHKGEQAQYLYDYSQLWCQVKTNSACYYNHEILYFSIEKVPQRCRELYDKYRGFTNALVLQGLSYEPSSSSANEAVATFKEALRAIDDQCFASPVYYWIGKRYEPFADRKEEAEESYALANERKVKFRNIFKLAVAARDKGDAARALELFDRITTKLTVRRKTRFTDPLELEYLFKVYYHQAYICYTGKNYAEAIDYAIKCKDIWETEIDESVYFDALYEDKAQDYRNASRNRLGIVKAYQMLGECYAQLLSKEKAEEYRNQARMMEEALKH